MSDVTMIGLGEMGGTLASCLVRAGKKVTVWNRTPEKASRLVADGAYLAASPQAAVVASPIVLVCVSDYPATFGILDNGESRSALAGRLLVQLSTGTPNQARKMAEWAGMSGARYLDGAILSWPRQIGTPEGTIITSGEAAAHAEAEPILRLLAGNLSHVGAAVGNASALFNAALAYLAGHWIGFSQGAVICESEGLDVKAFGEMMAELAPGLGEDNRHMGTAIASNRFGNPESTLKTAGTDIARLMQLSADAGIGAAFHTFAASVFRKGIEAGFGAEEHCAIVKVLRSM